jgi:hypothetical protein
MTLQLVRLALRAVMVVTPSWTLWLGLSSFMAVTAASLFFYERCRRHTYIAVLKAIEPGTLLLDRTRRKKEIAVIRLAQPRFSRHSNAVNLEEPKR